MNDAETFLPALTLQVQMQALATLGIDTQRIELLVGKLPEAPDALVPAQKYADMWAAAHAQFGRPGLATALAMAIPFGAFGALDYLAGSADTIAGCCNSAVMHFAMVASDTWVEHYERDDGMHTMQICAHSLMPGFVLEFTLAVLLNRLRYVTDNQFSVTQVKLPVPNPGNDSIRQQHWNAAILYDAPTAEFSMDAATWQRQAINADPFLHATLKHMANHLQLVQPGDSMVERAVHIRLRGALAQRSAEPARMASLIGVSERTLQRRLAEAGLSYSDIVESFRSKESMRLLRDSAIPIVEIAHRLGYAEQTSFTRAFRRWTGVTPNAWRNDESVVSRI